MTTLGSSFNYVATAQKPTNVTHSLVASFTSPDALNLIVARCTRIEIYALEAQGLVLLHDVPLYCRVATMELWKPGNRATEQIFISTERYQFCILSYDAQRKEIVTEAKGDVADRIGRASEVGQICVMEPNMKLIGLHLYDGLFKVIPAGAGGSLMTESFNIRLEELKVIDLCFLRGLPKSTLVMLFEDNKEGRHLKTYEVNLREKDLVEGPWAQANVEAGASRLIPIKTGGVIVLGETSITYLSGHDFKAIAVPFMLVRTCEPIDDTRFLLGDDRGGLHVLMLEMTAEPAGGSVMGLVLERMGTTSVPTTLSYLTDGIAFIGSSFGDSQLVQLQTQPVSSLPSSQPPPELTMAQAHPTAPPIPPDHVHTSTCKDVTPLLSLSFPPPPPLSLSPLLPALSLPTGRGRAVPYRAGALGEHRPHRRLLGGRSRTARAGLAGHVQRRRQGWVAAYRAQRHRHQRAGVDRDRRRQGAVGAPRRRPRGA